MALVPNALIFLLGEDLDEAVRLQSSLISAGIRNPMFALRDFKDSKEHLQQLAGREDWASLDAHLAIVSLDRAEEALELIQWLRGQEVFDRIFVLALADPAQPNALRSAIDYGADDVHYKYTDHEKLTRSVQKLPLLQARNQALPAECVALP